MENKLIGKKIVDVKIAEDKLAMLFVCDNGEELVVRVDADCCSYTWIESVEMPALGLPFTIIGCEDLAMPDLGDIPGCDYVQYYGAKITTNKGDMVIDYRNDSNGYYGGEIVWPGEGFYGGVYGQNESNMDWRDIEE
ncbi:hypothetical protein ASO78B_015 [Escherichia phage vB_EcoS_ASO78B]|nr:hypothetical protein ASO78B_015 [Escherichia phage vB_EcoS_ASO78B]